jgi:hypothetical protein
MKIKFTGFVVAFFMFIAIGNVFCQELRYIPLTWEIVNKLNNEKKLGDLIFYLSKSFTLRIRTQDSANKPDVTDDGLLDFGDKYPAVKSIEFTTKHQGKLDNFNDAFMDKEFLEISFWKHENVRFRFVRNTGKNVFELVSAVIDKNNYKLNFKDPPPYLAIIAKNGLIENVEVQAIPIRDDLKYPPQTQEENAKEGDYFSINEAGHFRNQSPTVDTKYGVILIKGQGLLPQTVIVEYIMQKNRDISQRNLENLIDTYFREARKEEINHDLAIAQMCRTTNFLRNEKIMETHNYAGFALTSEWGGRFSGGMKQGVVAHIQHLKGYTSNVRGNELKEPLADPRWNMLDGIRGTIHSLDDLSKRWSPNNAMAYENSVKDIINEMHRFWSRSNA